MTLSIGPETRTSGAKFGGHRRGGHGSARAAMAWGGVRKSNGFLTICPYNPIARRFFELGVRDLNTCTFNLDLRNSLTVESLKNIYIYPPSWAGFKSLESRPSWKGSCVLQLHPDAPEMRQCQTKSFLGNLVCFKTCTRDLRNSKIQHDRENPLSSSSCGTQPHTRHIIFLRL